MSNPKSIAVKVSNEHLSRAVQELAFRLGWEWRDGTKSFEYRGTHLIFRGHNTLKYFAWGCQVLDKSLPILDAATQFGEIVSWFSEPDGVEFTINSLTVKINPRLSEVDFKWSNRTLSLSFSDLDRIQSERNKLK